MSAVHLDHGSFRDPSGRVFHLDHRILRSVMPGAADAYRAVRDSGLLKTLVDRKWLLAADEIDPSTLAGVEDGASFVLEHPRVPYISYPYEWSFSLHRAAALLQLDVHLEALEQGFTLSDSTAYNVQFDGPNPVFIDHLSLRPYREGEMWIGHRQFCMQFLNPLLMWAKLGLQPNHWFRGALEGIAPEEMARMLPLSKRLNLTLLSHVTLQAALQKSSERKAETSAKARDAQLPKSAFKAMLMQLRQYISGLEPPGGITIWGDYAGNTSYSAEQACEKAEFVKEMVSAVKPGILFDLGCNSGDYSVAALDAGARKVIGFDFDHGALEHAYARAVAQKLDFLPLWLDAANPSPSQGWGQSERKGMTERANADALVALAFIHHIVIGRNVRLDMALDWMVSLAPTGIIEFPSKADPMVQRLLSQREDIFPDYTEEAFYNLLGQRARIAGQKRLSNDGRLLVWYDRRGG